MRAAALQAWRCASRGQRRKRELACAGNALSASHCLSRAFHAWLRFGARRRRVKALCERVGGGRDVTAARAGLRAWGAQALWRRRERQLLTPARARLATRACRGALRAWAAVVGTEKEGALLLAAALSRAAARPCALAVLRLRTAAAANSLGQSLRRRVALQRWRASQAARLRCDHLRFVAAAWHAAHARQRAVGAMAQYAGRRQRVAAAGRVLAEQRRVRAVALASRRWATFAAWRRGGLQVGREAEALRARRVALASLSAWQRRCCQRRPAYAAASREQERRTEATARRGLLAYRSVASRLVQLRALLASALLRHACCSLRQVLAAWAGAVGEARRQAQSEDAAEQASAQQSRHILASSLSSWRAFAVHHQRLRRVAAVALEREEAGQCDVLAAWLAAARCLLKLRAASREAEVSAAVALRRRGVAALAALARWAARRARDRARIPLAVGRRRAYCQKGVVWHWWYIARWRAKWRRAQLHHSASVWATAVRAWRAHAIVFSTVALMRKRVGARDIDFALFSCLRAWRRYASRLRRKREHLPAYTKAALDGIARVTLGAWHMLSRRRSNYVAAAAALRGESSLCAWTFGPWSQCAPLRKKKAQAASAAAAHITALRRRSALGAALRQASAHTLRRQLRRTQARLASAGVVSSLLSIATAAWISFARLQRRSRRILGSASLNLKLLRRRFTLQSWRRLTTSNREKSRGLAAFSLRRAQACSAESFRAWAAGAAIGRRQRCTLCEIMERRMTSISGFALKAWSWHAGLCREGRRVAAVFACKFVTRILEKCIRKWRLYLGWKERNRQITCCAETRWKRSAMEACWRSWTAFLQHRRRKKRLRSMAIEFRIVALKGASVSTWSTTSLWQRRARSILKELRRAGSCRTMCFAFAPWRVFASHSSQVRRAVRACRRAITVRNWRHWSAQRSRQRQGCSTLERGFAIARSREVFGNWRDTAHWTRLAPTLQSATHARLRCFALVRGLRSWSGRAGALRDHRNRCRGSVALFASRWVASCGVGAVANWRRWAAGRARIKGKLVDALAKRRLTALTLGIEIWRAAARWMSRKRCTTYVLTQSRDFRKRLRALHRWRSGFERRESVHAFFQGSASRRNFQLRLRYFGEWLGRARTWALKRRATQTSRVHYRARAFASSFRAWRDGAKSCRLRQRAVRGSLDRSRESMCSSALETWSSSNRRTRRKKLVASLACAASRAHRLRRTLLALVLLTRRRRRHRVALTSVAQKRRVATCARAWRAWCGEVVACATARAGAAALRVGAEAIAGHRCLAAWNARVRGKRRTADILGSTLAQRGCSSRRSSLRMWRETTVLRRRRNNTVDELSLRRRHSLLQRCAAAWRDLAWARRSWEQRRQAATAQWSRRLLLDGRRRGLTIWRGCIVKRRGLRQVIGSVCEGHMLRLMARCVCGLAAFHRWRALKRRALARGGEKRTRSILTLAWCHWGQLLALQCAQRQHIVPISARVDSRILQNALGVFAALLSWRGLKRAAALSSLRRAMALQSLACCSWHCVARWQARARHVIGNRRERQARHLMHVSVLGWHSVVSWVRRKICARSRGFNLVTQSAIARWVAAIKYRRWADAVVDASHSRSALAASGLAFQAWLAFGGLAQRTRRLVQAGRELMLVALLRRVVLTWRHAAGWQRSARQSVSRFATRWLLGGAEGALLLWHHMSLRKVERRREFFRVMQSWRRCFRQARQAHALRILRHMSAHCSWRRLAVKEAEWRSRTASKSHGLARWFGAGQARRGRRRSLRQALLLRAASCVGLVFALWSSACAAKASLRCSAGLLGVQLRGARRSCALAALVRYAAARQVWRSRIFAAMRMATSRVSAAAFSSWLGAFAANRLQHLQNTRAHEALLRTLGRAAVYAWRLATLGLKVAARDARALQRSCMDGWFAVTVARADRRRLIMWARRRLAMKGGMRAWQQWRHGRERLRGLDDGAAALARGMRLRAAFVGWRASLASSLEDARRLRKQLALRSATRRWRHKAGAQLACRLALRDATAVADRHSKRRISASALHCWCWHVAWAVANVEAAARLVRERRCARQRLEAQRRRALGLNEEEAEFLARLINAWRAKALAQLRHWGRVLREQAALRQALLMASLDAWVGAALPAPRAENLRRRRHVRFADKRLAPAAPATPAVPAAHAPSSERLRGPMAWPCPAAAPAPGRSPSRSGGNHSRNPSPPKPRAASPGTLGQWASVDSWQGSVLSVLALPAPEEVSTPGRARTSSVATSPVGRPHGFFASGSLGPGPPPALLAWRSPAVGEADAAMRRRSPEKVRQQRPPPPLTPPLALGCGAAAAMQLDSPWTPAKVSAGAERPVEGLGPGPGPGPRTVAPGAGNDILRFFKLRGFPELDCGGN